MTLPTIEASQAPTNPFNPLLQNSDNNPKEIQARYEAHRTARNAQFREKLLHKEFAGWKVDEILRKLITAQSTSDANPSRNNTGTPFVDHRHNLNFYARPPRHIRKLVAEIQQELKDIAPSLWFSPPKSLHITTLEVVSSQTAEVVDVLATHLQKTGAASKIVEYTNSPDHRARLVKPILSYDASAMALSFLPAAGEPSNHSLNSEIGDAFSYHHLRRDLADQVLGTGVELGARYIVPSVHVTIARFVSQEGADKKSVAALVEKIEEVNKMLKERYWPTENRMPVDGEWAVGHEEGLEFNKGTSWYGGGEKVVVGKGFE